MLIVAIILEAFFQIAPQSSFFFHHTAPLLQRFSPPLIDRVEANHALSLLIIKQLVVGVATSINHCATPAPCRGYKQIV